MLGVAGPCTSGVQLLVRQRFRQPHLFTLALAWPTITEQARQGMERRRIAPPNTEQQAIAVSPS